MVRYEIKWTVDLNPTEMGILSEEWGGFFKIKKDSIKWVHDLTPTEVSILNEEWRGFFEIKEVV